jgi:hypothetical protein
MHTIQFLLDLQVRLKKDDMAPWLAFSDEASFHVSGKVNHHIHDWARKSSSNY